MLLCYVYKYYHWSDPASAPDQNYVTKLMVCQMGSGYDTEKATIAVQIGCLVDSEVQWFGVSRACSGGFGGSVQLNQCKITLRVY